MVYKLTPYRNQLNLGQELSNPNVPFWSTVGASLGYTYDPMLEAISVGDGQAIAEPSPILIFINTIEIENWY